MNETLGYLKKILLTFIDPTFQKDINNWHFICWGDENFKSAIKEAIKTSYKCNIFIFSRRYLLNYFLFSWRLRLKKDDWKIRKVVYVNDGLLSSFFDSENVAAYSRFTKNHLPQRKGLVRKIISFAPVIWRAAQRFIIVEKYPDKGHLAEGIVKAIEESNFLIFSNANGKLLLTKTQTIITGKGQVINTTANSDYSSIMKKEYAILSHLSTKSGGSKCLPRVGKSHEIQGTFFFIEDYISGRSLRDILNDLAMVNLSNQACEIIERLDAWYNKLFLTFSEEPLKKIMPLYAPIIKTFAELYSDKTVTHSVVNNVIASLQFIDSSHPGLVSMITHNDLWPSNLILTSENIVAIDWERATEDHAGVFDYFWMMISAAIVYLKELKRLPNYSISFQCFLKNDDEISKCVHNKLHNFIVKMGFDDQLYDFFMVLFLMEWSIQGFIHLHHQNAMDKLAFEELLSFLKKTKLAY